ncbi:hypothetical protein ACT1UF_10795 [Clostridium septicum]|uniref:hypothetical protein n=1 Tax=Clostridium septicum TaxID=1504 RepID=UPI000834AE19|nr:hypothetical protein [Clostridium septicum]
MNILFDEKAKEGLLELVNNGSNDYVRVKVAAVGCGKPAYDIYCDYKSQNDIEVEISSIKFVIDKKDERLCDNIEIKYDKDIYNNGFYIRSL